MSIAHVKYFSADNSCRRLQGTHDRFHNIAHMDKWPPLQTIEDCDFAFLLCSCTEEIDNQVESRPVAKTEYRREAKDRRVEFSARRREQGLLGVNLGLGIYRNRVQFRALVDLMVRGAVDTAA